MKLFKKILLLSAALATCIGFSAATACGALPGASNSGTSDVENSVVSDAASDATSADSAADSSSDSETAKLVHRISVQNATGFGFSNVNVTLKSGDTVVATKRTNASGNANFFEKDNVEVGTYSLEIEGIPEGYVLPEALPQTVAVAGSQTIVEITPTGVLQSEPAADSYYRLGDVVHDFTVKLSNGASYKLSEILQEKKLVMLNFWATWCGPCKSEFPAMHDAVSVYTETVSTLAISTTDDKQTAQSFMDSNGYTNFNVSAVTGDAACSRLHSMFQVSGIPHTVMIDRYGVVVFNHVSSMPSASMFTLQFDKFVGEDYLPTVVGGQTEDNNGGGNEGGGNEQIKPNVPAPDVDELKDVLTTETTKDFSFRFQEEEDLLPGEEGYDEYNWPWAISEDGSYLYASNVNINNSYSILYSSITAKAGDVLTFDYKIGSEYDADILYVMLDGVIIKEYSGNYAANWLTSYAYVFRDYEAGAHELAFVFLKDSATMAYEDVVQIKALRMQTLADIENSEESIDIFRYAATQRNEDPKTQTQFKNYVSVVLNEADEYYHVGDKNGPVLYANVMNASLWSEASLWLLAYNNYVVGDGMNYRDAIEDFAWEAAQVTTVYGYTPVTEDLKYLLDAAARYTSYGELWSGAYHENEWLELCVYWEHYGLAEMPEDPMAGISFTGAIPMYAGDKTNHVPNEISVPFPMSPRGFKYKFIPETTGAYHVYSTGNSDSIVFLVASDRTTQLGYWDNKVFADEADGNFEFYWNFEAGETYYLLFTTYLDQAAVYNVNIDFVGDNYQYFTNAAVGPYSANLNTFELFLPDAIRYAYSDPAEGGDGYYHHVKADGTLGSIIYLDVDRPTAFFTSNSIYDICIEALTEYTEDITKRAFYVDGVDYTEAFLEIAYNAKEQSGELKGFAPVDKELFEMLQTLTIKGFDGIEESWLLLCYYYKQL